MMMVGAFLRAEPVVVPSFDLLRAFGGQALQSEGLGPVQDPQDGSHAVHVQLSSYSLALQNVEVPSARHT